MPGHTRLSVVHVDEGRENAHEGRLPGTVRSEESEYGGWFDIDVDARQRLDVAVRLGDAAHHHRWLGPVARLHHVFPSGFLPR